GLFVDRMRSALTLQARQLIGADLVVTADRAIPAGWQTRAQDIGLTTAQTVVFPSMAVAGSTSQLASVKAVSREYPLRGAVRIADAPGGPDREAGEAPRQGEAWLDPQLADALHLRVGDTVQ